MTWTYNVENLIFIRVNNGEIDVCCKLTSLCGWMDGDTRDIMSKRGKILMATIDKML